MYNAHRGIGQQPANNSNHRLSELFDQIRREFDVHAQDRAGEHDQNSRLLDFSESFARLHAVPRSTAVSYVVTMESAKEIQAMLFFLNASSSPLHMFRTNCESSKRASTFDG